MQQNFFQSLHIIWFALLSGQVILLIVLGFVVPIEPVPDLDVLKYIAPAILLGGMAFGTALYKQLLEKATNQELINKFNTYRTANIVKGAMIEGPNLFCIVAYSMTKTSWLLFMIVGGLIWMYLQTPSKFKFIQEVSLTPEEQAGM